MKIVVALFAGAMIYYFHTGATLPRNAAERGYTMSLSRNMSKSEMNVQIERARDLLERYRGQARFLRLTADNGRQNTGRRVCVQAAWNERRSLRYWKAEAAMTREQLHAREVDGAIKRLAAEIVFWRDAMHCTTAELIARVRNWERVGDMAYSRSVRGVAVAVMLDIYA